MTGIAIRLSGPQDAARVNDALRRLSAGLGDRHRVDDAALAEAGWGAHPVFRAMLAERGEATIGVAVYSATFSTLRGGVIAYVSDLWVLEEARGSGVGRGLLGAVVRDASATWRAVGLKLNVYDSAPRAVEFYERLGFAAAAGQRELHLDAAGCAALEGME